MEIIEKSGAWKDQYGKWRRWQGNNNPHSTNVRASNKKDPLPADYPWVTNQRAPFRPARRALPMLNLALVTSAGAYIDGTEPFDTDARDGDATFREIPTQVEAQDLKIAARGYDDQAVLKDLNAQIPLDRLNEFQGNGIIGQFNSVFWSVCGYIPDAGKVTQDLAPQLVDRLTRYEVQAALLVPASRLCHQTLSLVARALEANNIPTMLIAVDRGVVEAVRPPRAALYKGEFGSVAGLPNYPEHQRRVLDESLRLLESLDQVGVRRLTVGLESEVEKQRGEK